MGNKKGLVISSLIILVIAIIAVTYLLFQEKKEKSDMTQLFDLEKEEMENEYTRFANQYDELQYQLSNDSLINVLESEKIKTQRLLEELRSVKTTNAKEIMRLKKELATVRSVLRTYIVQIDSLNRVNQVLKEENKQVRQKYSEAARQITNLAEEKKKLNEKVELASQLDATNIWIKAKNKRDKEAKKVKDVVKFAIGFTIVKNISAPTGERTLYIRITKPDNDVLTKSQSNTFQYENRTLNYSIKKYIEYTGEEQNVTVYWNVEEFLYAGTYRVDIFADGILIGSQRFTLD
ncbi:MULTISPECIES: hypothetical protein [unclassified Bacteroides]|jgi:predicted RNase H-like nuclease (RuvC/YqgF family)|uniref:hypothetical protein n=1 Tax=unclassified Bacteroides TaxID=2646097 RepID=UPI000E95D3FC|nr:MULTISPECIES: hypothetical protein [unclassified Bacteroides]RGN46069.1 hypothetical protein DXB63_11755 [Bacteroides sp. OM05-12]RHR74057.1 hypothetical protein DWW69_13600 [Bacteroides sp. AF16-49]